MHRSHLPARGRLLLVAFALFLSIAASPPTSQAATRMVLGELFTTAGCGYCPIAIAGFRELHEQYGAAEFTSITWSLSLPYVIPEAQTRQSWYLVTGVPRAWFDGHDPIWGVVPDAETMFPYYDPIVADHLDDPSPLEIQSFYRLAGALAGTLFVDVDVTVDVATSDNVVHMVIVEDHVGHEIRLARATLADEPFAATEQGESVQVARTFALDPAWNLDELDFVVFVQSHDTSKEMLQATTARRANGIVVAPEEDLTAMGSQGGPFAPSGKVYTIENLGAGPVEYHVSADAPWVSVANASGTLSGASSTEVTIELNDLAGTLSQGAHVAGVSFANITNHVGDETRGVELLIGAPILAHSFPIDDSEGWENEWWWWFGQPGGEGGENGPPDPTSGHTGPNVYGYDIGGDYTNDLSEKHLTTTPIDCLGLRDVRLKFWRWLGVQKAPKDHAYVRVSNDGTNFTTVWENPSSDDIEDAAWIQQECDISEVADDEPTVYVRWTMGSTDGSRRYCGWNIDDVEIWGHMETTSGVAEPGERDAAVLLPNYPNPFNPSTTIAFDLTEAALVDLAVYDTSGRLVRTLMDSPTEPGRHAITWDGRSDAGRSVASGVYFVKLRVNGRVHVDRMVLMK